MSIESSNLVISRDGTNHASTRESIIIGGAETTVQISGAICIGSNTQTLTLNPSTHHLYFKDSPIIIASNTNYGSTGTLNAADIATGFINITIGGAYTFDSSVNLYSALWDSTGSALGTFRPQIYVTVYNGSTGTVTINPGTGQSLANGLSSIIIRTGQSQLLNLLFITATTMIIQNIISPNFIYNASGLINNVKQWAGSTTTSSGSATFNLTSAGFSTIVSATTSVVNNATAPNQCWAVITSQSTTSVTVTVYRSAFTGVTVLGINVIGTATQEIYTGASVTVNLIVIGN